MSSDNSFFLNSSTQNLSLSGTPSQPASGASGQITTGGPFYYHYGVATSIAFMDELVKEYLLFRGFQATIKSFEHDIKQDKDRSFRADKITEQLFAYIHAYDLSGLLDYWSYLDHKFFSKITLKLTPYSSASLSRKYELFLLRYYLINAIQTGKPDKAVELFENYATKLQSQSEWREWYCLPFLKNPEENLVFGLYFNKNWKDAFIVSLQNFLNIVFQSVTFPRLLNYDEDAFWNKQTLFQRNQSNSTFCSSYSTFEQDYFATDPSDEFQPIQTDNRPQQAGNNNNNGSFLSMIKNLTGNSGSNKQSTSKTSSSSNVINQGMSTNTSSLMAAEVLSQSVAKILSTKSSAFDYTVNNRILTSQRRVSAKAAAAASTTTSNETNTKAEEPIEQKKQAPETINEENNKKEDQIPANEPYLTLSEEEYNEHKATILHCKFSYDGKFVASVDTSGLIKIWSIVENAASTVSTIMQKSFVLCIEWDKRFNHILYIGTKTCSVKLYDIHQKRIVQELTFNKLYPLITHINPLVSTDKVAICMGGKPVQKRNETVRNGQMAICNLNNINFNLSIEKLVDLDGYYSQCSLSYQLSRMLILGGSDGLIRVYDLFSTPKLIAEEKCYQNEPILCLALNQSQTILVTCSSSGLIKSWSIQNTTPDDSNETVIKISFLNQIDNITLPVCTYDQLMPSEYQTDLNKMFHAACMLKFDSTDAFLYTLSTRHSGACLIESGSFASRLVETRQQFSYHQDSPILATSLEAWNASHLCILLLGGQNGTIKLVKLLHQY